MTNRISYPYASQKNKYWTGYFTSRPALKGLAKQQGRYLQSMRTYLSLLVYLRLSDFLVENEQHYLRQVDTL